MTATTTDEKYVASGEKGYDSNGSSSDHDHEAGEIKTENKLARDLKGRHMQMIAIGEYCAARIRAGDLVLMLFQVVPLALVSLSVLVKRFPTVVQRLWYVKASDFLS